MFLSGVATGKLPMLLWVALLSCLLCGPIKLSYKTKPKTETKLNSKTVRRILGAGGERNIWG